MQMFKDQKIFIKIIDVSGDTYQESIDLKRIGNRNASLYVNGKEFISVRNWSDSDDDFGKRIKIKIDDGIAEFVVFDKNKSSNHLTAPAGNKFKYVFYEKVAKLISHLCREHFEGKERLELTLDLKKIGEEVLSECAKTEEPTTASVQIKEILDEAYAE